MLDCNVVTDGAVV